MAQTLELIEGSGIASQIELSAHKDLRNFRAEVNHFRIPLAGDVLKGHRVGDGEAHQENIGVGIAQGSKSVIFLLTCNPSSTAKRKSQAFRW